MKLKYQPKSKFWTKGLTALIVMLLASLTANAQCKFVTTSEAGAKIEIVLPNTFPIYHYLNDHKTEDVAFNKSVASFRLLYPALNDVIFKPLDIPNDPKTYIEIPQTVFDGMPQVDKDAILFLQSFYKIIKSN